jgi:hypothetical protein
VTFGLESPPTFLSIYTPTYRRPVMLEACRASVRIQTVPVEHVIIEDAIGIGIDGVYAAIPQHAGKVTGDYVMVLSDDNVLVDERFAEELAQETEQAGFPDVVMFRGQINTSLQPVAWRTEPRITMVDLSCFAVARQIWQKHADRWGHRYEGDYDFIHALWELGYRFHWWDRLAFRALQISRGQPETA